MTGKDIIKAGKVKVRNSPSLYPAYQELFKEAFGYAPECPTCGSAQGHRDWSAFETYVNTNTITNTKKIEQMAANKTFVLRDKNKIYSLDYKHQNGRILRKRVYGYAMDDAWAEEYLANADGLASEKEMAARIAEFKTFPESQTTAAVEVSLTDLTKAELSEMLASMNVDEAQYKNLKKDELVALVESTKIESEAEPKTVVEDETKTVVENAEAKAESDDSLLD